ncbi:MAG: hypothetical protein QOC60_52 [Frankiaceae bacterium]|nr:hypothetical protein [Frankiaceae bacterium]
MPGVRRATVAVALATMLGCTPQAPTGPAGTSAAAPPGGGSPTPTSQVSSQGAAGAAFAGQVLVYAVHGFNPTETAAISRRLGVPVTRAYTTERQLRTANAALTIPVSVLYTNAAAYSAAAGQPDLAGPLKAGVVLATGEAALRHAKVGDSMRFATGADLPVTAVVDAHLIGGHEMATANAALLPPTAQASSYLLVGGLSVATIKAGVAAAVPTRAVRVKTTTENGYLSSTDTVLTQLQMKQLFGEFTVQKLPNGSLVPGASWVTSHIVDRRITQLGVVTCNKGVMADLTAAMTEITRRNIGSIVHTADFQYEGGCYNPSVIPFSNGGALSAHTWGVAVDINVDVNPLGAAPHQDPRLVAIMRAHNFMWGGTFLRTDAAHFEWVGPTVKH